VKFLKFPDFTLSPSQIVRGLTTSIMMPVFFAVPLLVAKKLFFSVHKHNFIMVHMIIKTVTTTHLQNLTPICNIFPNVNFSITIPIIYIWPINFWNFSQYFRFFTRTSDKRSPTHP